MNKVHYPNLNFVRGFAALVVIIHHTEQLKFIHGYSNLWQCQPISLMGRLGVDLFFVLSGFLITSLLFVEKQLFEKIAIKKFLMRRVLRIWPVYFVVMIIAFFITPHIPELYVGGPFMPVQPHIIASLILYLLFLPHVQAFLIGPIIFCAQAWSIGVEEYFYVFWPFVVDKLNPKKLMYFIIGFVVIYVFSCLVMRYLGKHIYADNIWFQKINTCLTEGLKYDCLLIGGFFAIVNHYLKDIKTIITSKLFQISTIVIELLLIFFGRNLYGFDWELHAVIYGFVILNLVRPTSILHLEYPIFDFLGKISYGLYMYHVLIVNICIVIVYKIGMPFLLYPLIFVSVISVATLSYKYFESYFLKRKLTYSTIITG